MKKLVLYLLLTVLVILPVQGFSQSFTWQVDSTAKLGVPVQHFEFHTYLYNNTSDTINLRIVRMVNQIPNGWLSFFCLGTLCSAPFTDTVYAKIPGSGSDSLILHMDTSSDPTIGTVVVKVENQANPSEFVENSFIASTGPAIGIRKNQSAALTGRYQLFKNYPNPFNPFTHIPFEVGNPGSQRIVISIYSILGQRIRTLLDARMQPGFYEITWDGSDDSGTPVSTGLYLYEMRTQQEVLMGRMILLK